MNVNLIAIDIAKSVVEILLTNSQGRKIATKRIRRSQLLGYLQTQERCVVALEACGGSHYWGRELQKLGFEVRLVATVEVKRMRGENKSDAEDAKIIARVAMREDLHFIPVKSIEQQELQTLHRVREQYVKMRTALSNQMHGILLEFGIAMSKGKKSLSALPALLELHAEKLPSLVREALQKTWDEYRHLDEVAEHWQKLLERIAAQHPVCKRLMKVTGVGPLTATAAISATDPHQFANSRAFAAWVGWTPRQCSSGEKTRLGRVKRRGCSALRQYLLQGACSAVASSHRRSDGISVWVSQLKQRKGLARAAVALANKNARILWVLMVRDEAYRLRTA